MSMTNEIKSASSKDDTNFFIRVLKYFVPWKGNNVGEVMRKFVFIGSIAVFAVSLNSLADYLRADEQELGYFEEIQSLEPTFDTSGDSIDTSNKNGAVSTVDNPAYEYQESERKLQDWAMPLLNRNEDVVGWLKIPGIVNPSTNEPYINYPVLQHESNNDYYLHRNIDNQKTESGSIFADCIVPITLESQADNITIYGHNMMSGTQFAHLTAFKKGADFIKENPIIEFNTIYEQNAKYVIIGCFVGMDKIEQDYDTETAFDYWNYRNFTEGHYSFDTWYENMTKCSWLSSNVECTPNDDYITLSTCSYELSKCRWVVIAKKLTAKDDVDSIIKSYKDKADKDIYFFENWVNVYGNKKVITG